MRRFFVAVVVLEIVSFHNLPARADELTLKDGRKIEWVQVVDQGDELRIRLKDGKQITLPKHEIRSLMVPSALKAPLTGASFTFAKTLKLKRTNILASIKPAEDAPNGQWTFSSGILSGAPKGSSPYGRLMIRNVSFPDEYDLAMVVERLAGNGSFNFGMTVGGQRMLFCIDRGKSSGPMIVQDGRYPLGNPKYGQIFTKNRIPHSFVFMVRKAGLVVRLDGKDFYSWKVGGKHLAVEPRQDVPIKTIPWILVTTSTWRIRGIILSEPIEDRGGSK